MPGSTEVLFPLAVPGDAGPTHIASKGKGGGWSVADAAARDLIHQSQREEGLRIVTNDDGKEWKLGAGLGNGDWSEVVSGGSVFVPPDGPTEAPVPAVFVSAISAPAFDGTYFWTCDFGSATIQKVNRSGPFPWVVKTIDLSNFSGSVGPSITQIKFFNGNIYACVTNQAAIYQGPQAAAKWLVVIDAASAEIVGYFLLPDASALICQAVTFDTFGNVWVVGVDPNASFPGPGGGMLYQIIIADMLAAFPSVATAQSSYPTQDYIQDMTFGAGSLWLVSGSGYGNTNTFTGDGTPRVFRVNPADGTYVTQEGSGAYTALFANGSLWTSGYYVGPGHLYRFDPGTFPSAPTDIDVSSVVGGITAISSDGTDIWLAGVGPWARMSTGVGTEAIVSSGDSSPIAAYAFAFDGTSAWAVDGASLTRWTTGVGTETINWLIRTGLPIYSTAEKTGNDFVYAEGIALSGRVGGNIFATAIEAYDAAHALGVPARFVVNDGGSGSAGSFLPIGRTYDFGIIEIASATLTVPSLAIQSDVEVSAYSVIRGVQVVAATPTTTLGALIHVRLEDGASISCSGGNLIRNIAGVLSKTFLYVGNDCVADVSFSYYADVTVLGNGQFDPGFQSQFAGNIRFVSPAAGLPLQFTQIPGSGYIQLTSRAELVGYDDTRVFQNTLIPNPNPRTGPSVQDAVDAIKISVVLTTPIAPIAPGAFIQKSVVFAAVVNFGSPLTLPYPQRVFQLAATAFRIHAECTVFKDDWSKVGTFRVEALAYCSGGTLTLRDQTATLDYVGDVELNDSGLTFDIDLTGSTQDFPGKIRVTQAANFRSSFVTITIQTISPEG